MQNIYFITSTVKNWIPIFHRKEFQDIVINSLDFLIDEKRTPLHGDVLTLNRLHVQRVERRTAGVALARFISNPLHCGTKPRPINDGCDFRQRVEEIFGWMKAFGGFRKTRFRGLARCGEQGLMTAAAYNPMRISRMAA